MFQKKVKPSPRKRPSRSSTRNGNAVFSYYAANRPDDTQNAGSGANKGEQPASAAGKHRRKTAKTVLRRSLQVVVALAIAVIVVINLGLSKTPQVVVVGGADAEGVVLQDTSVYQEAAKTELAASFWNNNKLTIDVEHIRTALKEQFPELTDVSIVLPFVGRQPELRIQPSSARLIIEAANGNFVVDTEGRVLGAEGELSSQLQKTSLPRVRDESGLPHTTGQAALSGPQIGFIGEVVRQLKAKDVKIQSMLLPRASNDLHVRVVGHNGEGEYIVKFTTQGDARLQAGAYLATRQQLEKENKKPNEYVDVRVGHRVFYK